MRASKERMTKLMNASSESSTPDVRIEGDVSGQVAAGEAVTQTGDIHGDVTIGTTIVHEASTPADLAIAEAMALFGGTKTDAHA